MIKQSRIMEKWVAGTTHLLASYRVSECLPTPHVCSAYIRLGVSILQISMSSSLQSSKHLMAPQGHLTALYLRGPLSGRVYGQLLLHASFWQGHCNGPPRCMGHLGNPLWQNVAETANFGSPPWPLEHDGCRRNFRGLHDHSGALS